VRRPESQARPEQRILDEAFNGWIDLLRKEAVRRADLSTNETRKKVKLVARTTGSLPLHWRRDSTLTAWAATS
jgi:hypothetical protein